MAQVCEQPAPQNCLQAQAGGQLPQNMGRNKNPCENNTSHRQRQEHPTTTACKRGMQWGQSHPFPNFIMDDHDYSDRVER
jgi:hypothetical protein